MRRVSEVADRAFTLDRRPFTACAEPPGDKSLAHRALILAALAIGRSTVRNAPIAGDVDSTRRAITALGVHCEGDSVDSPGIGGWTRPNTTVDCGNSGTTMRLLSGALSASPVGATLVGDRSLMRRPMQRLVEPLRALGADITVARDGTAPVEVSGSDLQGTDVSIGIPSAQVRTAVALAALGASGASRIDSPPGFRDHTERWLGALGRGAMDGPTAFVVDPGPIPPLDVSLPGDPSSAAFLWAAAAVCAGSELTTPAVSLNPGRTGFLEVLGAMGADIEITDRSDVLGDPTGTVSVRGRPLTGVDVGGTMAVRALDELPLLAVVAAAATGATRVAGASELRFKESDRIASSVRLALLAGADAQESDDGFVVRPGEETASHAAIDADKDHRVAMAAAVAALVRGSSVRIDGFEAASVSWPGFGEVLEGLWS